MNENDFPPLSKSSALKPRLPPPDPPNVSVSAMEEGSAPMGPQQITLEAPSESSDITMVDQISLGSATTPQEPPAAPLEPIRTPSAAPATQSTVQQPMQRSFKDMVDQGSFPHAGGQLTEEDILKYVQIEIPEGVKGIPSVTIAKEMVDTLAKAWTNSVVIKLLGRPVSFTVLERRLEEMWRPQGKICIVDLTGGFSIVRFEFDVDCWHALTGGPWNIFGQALMVQKWDQAFNPNKDTIKTICTWVKLTNLPVIFYEQKILEQIARSIGKPLHVDKHTLQASRGKFARICVVLDLSKPLRGAIMVNGEMWAYGERCALNTTTPPQVTAGILDSRVVEKGKIVEQAGTSSENTQSVGASTAANSQECPDWLGTWMLPKPYVPRQNPNSKKSKESKVGMGPTENRFSALSSDMADPTKETNHQSQNKDKELTASKPETWRKKGEKGTMKEPVEVKGVFSWSGQQLGKECAEGGLGTTSLALKGGKLGKKYRVKNGNKAVDELGLSSEVKRGPIKRRRGRAIPDDKGGHGIPPNPPFPFNKEQEGGSIPQPDPGESDREREESPKKSGSDGAEVEANSDPIGVDGATIDQDEWEMATQEVSQDTRMEELEQSAANGQSKTMETS
ncbi:LOW QUALITY PROTEIN: hypothetical protein V2J09_007707 [Rumex salicifolius]